MFVPRALPRSLSAALRDATDPKPEVRISAVSELGRFRAEGEATMVLERLLQSLTTDSDHRVRSEAAVALADLGAPGAEVALLAASEDVHPRVRQMSLLALGELGRENPAAVERMRAACHDELAGLRFQGLIALASALGAEAKHELVAALTDGDAEVRYIAVRLLEEHLLPAERSHELTEAVRRRLADSDASVRLAAALVASREGIPEASELIVSVLNARARIRFAEDEEAAIAVAGDRELAGAIPGLRRRVGGWLVRKPFDFHARVALCQLGDSEISSRLLADLGSRNPHVRSVALAAVARARFIQAKAVIEALSPADEGERESRALALAALRER